MSSPWLFIFPMFFDFEFRSYVSGSGFRIQRGWELGFNTRHFVPRVNSLPRIQPWAEFSEEAIAVFSYGRVSNWGGS